MRARSMSDASETSENNENSSFDATDFLLEAMATGEAAKRRKTTVESIFTRIGLTLRWLTHSLTNDENTLREKVMIVSYFIVIPSIGLSGLFWGIAMLSLGHYYSSIAPFVYFVSSIIVSLLVITKCLDVLKASTIMLIFLQLLPLAVHFIPGAFEESGAVIVWSVVAPPLAVILLQSRKMLLRFFISTLMLVGLAKLATELTTDQLIALREQESLIGAERIVFFVMNLFVPCTILVISLLYYEVRLSREQHLSDQLLFQVLPRRIARRLKRGVPREQLVDSHSNVTIFFSDICGFTEMSTRYSPAEVISVLQEIFNSFDDLAKQTGCYRIDTIGDAYFLACGVPKTVEATEAARRVAAFALRVQDTMIEFNKRYGIQIRIGIHTGDVVSGVLGFKFSLIGDAVNTAARMEQTGLPGKIHCSKTTFELLSDSHTFEARGGVQIKGKGKMQTYWLISNTKWEISNNENHSKRRKKRTNK